jgi:hypothetical protein
LSIHWQVAALVLSLAGSVRGQTVSYNWTRAIEPGRGAFPSQWTEGQWPMAIQPVLGIGDKLWMVDSSSVWSSSDAINWERVATRLPWRPRSGMMIAYFDGKLWALGGQEGARLRNDIWFSTDGISWRIASEKASWSPRAAMIGSG